MRNSLRIGIFFCILSSLALWRWQAFNLSNQTELGVCHRSGKKKIWTLSGYLGRYSGRWFLIRTRLLDGAESLGLSGRVRFSKSQAFPRSWRAKRVTLLARLRCALDHRNPSRKNDFGNLFVGRFRVTKIHAIRVAKSDSLWYLILRKSFLNKIESAVKGYPSLQALLLATFTGDESEVPTSVIEFYRRTGILHVLALSGQHVAIFCWICVGLLKYLFRRTYYVSGVIQARPYFWLFCLFVPLVCVSGFMILSLGEPSVVRVSVFVLCVVLMRMRGLSFGTQRTLWLSCGYLLLLFPRYLLRPGFVLSCFATAFVLAVLDRYRKKPAWQLYLILSLQMPLWLFPLGLYFFGKLPLLSICMNVAFVWVWDLILLPVTFVVGGTVFLCPFSLHWLLRFFDFLLEHFFRWQAGLSEAVSSFYLTSYRPTIWEWLILLLCALYCLSLPTVRQRASH